MTKYMTEQMEHGPTREMYETIYEIAKKQNYKNALEVGVAWAISTVAILSAGTGKLVSVDKSDYPNTKEQVNAYGFRERWRFIESPSEETLPELPWKYDLICIDGDHRYKQVLDDLESAVKLLADDGVIIVDDYNHKNNFTKDPDIERHYGVHKAVNEIVDKYKLKIIVYNKANGIVELRK